MAQAEVNRVNKAQKMVTLELTTVQAKWIALACWLASWNVDAAPRQHQGYLGAYEAIKGALRHPRGYGWVDALDGGDANSREVTQGSLPEMGEIAPAKVFEVLPGDSPDDTVVLTMTRAQAVTVLDDARCAPVYEALEEAGIR